MISCPILNYCASLLKQNVSDEAKLPKYYSFTIVAAHVQAHVQDGFI